jgi:CDP-glucose 4,6-dehydratase
MLNPEFWKRQRVLLTGHTGFKGSWTALWLSRLGATQLGYSLEPETRPSLFTLLGGVDGLESVIGDIRDAAGLSRRIAGFDPTVAIHMAAQPLVRRSYREPAETYATNVMGTLNVLEALRSAPNLRAVLVITTDKVYRNDDSGRAFREDDPLGGHDPYSSSKAACEEVVSCYRQSFFEEKGVRIATARAGNVVGGGDWSQDRLIPDIWRAVLKREPVTLRYPKSVRPWQHVLDPVSGYLRYVEALAAVDGDSLPPALNFAPAADAPLTVQEVTEMLGRSLGMNQPWTLAEGNQPAEMKLLMLDASLAHRSLGWQPRLNGKQAIEWSASWYLQQHNSVPARLLTEDQIDAYEAMSARRR